MIMVHETIDAKTNREHAVHITALQNFLHTYSPHMYTVLKQFGSARTCKKPRDEDVQLKSLCETPRGLNCVCWC